MITTADSVYEGYSRLSKDEKSKFLHRITVQPEILAYSADGVPLTREKYLAEINQAIEEIEQGDFVTHEEVVSKFRSGEMFKI
jgi:hypothetical protein